MNRDKSFRDGIASLKQGRNTTLYLLPVPSRRDGKVERRPHMYTGTLIDELIATVEQTQTRVQRHLPDTRSQEERLAYWYAVAQQEVAQIESSLAGVA